MTPRKQQDPNGQDDRETRGPLLMLGANPPAAVEERLRERMRSKWAGLAASEPRVPRRWPAPMRWRIAAGLLLCGSILAAAAVFLSNGGAAPALAQVMQTIRKARSVHAQASRLVDGKLVVQAEIWYSPELGVREQEMVAGQRSIRIDDTRHEWICREATRTVVQGRTRDPIGVIRKMLDPLNAMERMKAQRARDLDGRIGDIAGEAYAASRGDDGHRRRVFWLDAARRLIRYEEQDQRQESWAVTERIDLAYDQPLDPKLFTPDFGSDVRIIDRTKPLSGFEPGKSLTTAERLGIVLAVHQVRRVEGGAVFVMITSRGNADVIKRLGPIHSGNGGNMRIYGAFTFSTNGRRLDDGTWVEGYLPVQIAEWTCDGIEYSWVLLLDSQGFIRDDGTLPVGFHVHTSDAWNAALAAEGKPTWLWAEKDVVRLKVPREAKSLDAVLADVYEQTLAMGDGARTGGSPYLYLKPVPYTQKQIEEAVAQGTPREQAERMSVQPTVSPERTTLDAWRKEFKAYVDDIEAQRRAAMQKR